MDMKDEAAMARKPVTSISERRPNKERSLNHNLNPSFIPHPGLALSGTVV
jgi:hypothetical protein